MYIVKEVAFMRKNSFIVSVLTIVLMFVSLVLGSAFATTFYVDASRPDDSGDGLSWATSKMTIQAGVDIAVEGDTVLVTNGVYDVGSRLSPGQALCHSRVVINKPLTVQSVNGLSNTFIVGQGPIGADAIRGVWIADNACISGFTITNGHTAGSIGGDDEKGGGVCAEGAGAIIQACTITSSKAAGSGGGVYAGSLNNCTIDGNESATGAGGVAGSLLNNCMIANNKSDSGRGGGASNCSMSNCVVIANTTTEWGGGVYKSHLSYCVIISNTTVGFMSHGGGAYGGELNNCLVKNNRATVRWSLGGGANNATLNNCLVVENWAYPIEGDVPVGGGTQSCTLNNCTLTQNNSVQAYGGTAHNTIIYGGSKDVTTAYCYTDDPLFVDALAGDFRLQSNSPCINAGFNGLAPTNITPYDLDNNPRILGGIVDIGAYEFVGSSFFISIEAGSHGVVVPEGRMAVDHGGSLSVEFEPEQYYQVMDVFTNGGSTGASGITNFTWNNIGSDGTLLVEFTALTTISNVPLWWLAQYGWTNDFENAAIADYDADNLPAWREYACGTCPTNCNTDGDQFNDGIEVHSGANPLNNDSQVYGAILSDSKQFGFYTESNIVDISYGQAIMAISNSTARITLCMEMSDNLIEGSWTNAGDEITWSVPVKSSAAFFRFHGHE